MPEVVTTVAITFQGDTAQLPQNTRIQRSRQESLARELFVLATYGGDAPPAVFTRLEAALRCDEAPIATTFRELTRVSQTACMRGLWTGANERLIAAAAHAPAVAALYPGRLFPKDPGTRPCAIPTSGSSRPTTIAGQCGVYVLGNTVSFMEDLVGPQRRGRRVRLGIDPMVGRLLEAPLLDSGRERRTRRLQLADRRRPAPAPALTRRRARRPPRTPTHSGGLGRVNRAQPRGVIAHRDDGSFGVSR